MIRDMTKVYRVTWDGQEIPWHISARNRLHALKILLDMLKHRSTWALGSLNFVEVVA